MKNFLRPDFIFYAAASLLYWWLVYIAIKLALVLRCGLGPDAPDDCTNEFPYIIPAVAFAFYGVLAWMTIRENK